MTKFAGRKAKVCKEGALTYGQTCVIDSWHHEIKRYKVLFDNDWYGRNINHGWYKRSELEIIKGQ